MPAPTTLLAARIAETARIEAALAALATAQRNAGAAEVAGTAALTAAARDVTTARAAAEAARKALAAIPTPADGEPLLEALRTAIATLRRVEAAQVAAEAAPQAARAALARLSARAATLKAALTAAVAAREAERAATLRREGWKADAVVPPLSELPQAAAAAKVEADLPANAAAERSLLAQVRTRRVHGGQASTDAAGRATQALATEKGWAEATTREAAKLPALQRAFDASLAALAAFVGAAPQVARAAEALAALAARPASPLTDAQRAALFSGDAAVTAAREAALAKLKTRDDAVAALATARRAWEEALANARAAAPDATEAELLAAQPALVPLHDAIATKEGELATARGAITPAEAALLEAWFAAIPDPLWEQLEALDESRAVLQAMAATDPAALVADLVAKEAALAAALDGAAREERIAALLAEDVAATRDTAAVAAGSAPRRRRAAARFVAEA